MTEWLDDENDLFGATLRLIAAWDNVEHGSPSSTASSSPSPPSTAGMNTRKINVSRERRKQELLYLRKISTELHHQLRYLRERRDAQLRPHFHDAQRTQLATVAPVWENLAIRQYHARKRSEMDNVKLKTMMAAQLRVAQDLLRAIEMSEQRSREIGPAVPTHPWNPVAHSPAREEEEQLARLDVLSKTWTTEFAQCEKFAGDDHSTLQFMDMTVVEESEEMATIEIFHSYVVPFSVTRVEEVLWGIEMKEGSKGDDGESYTQHTKVSDDQIMSVFKATVNQNDSCEGAFYGKSITKRMHPTATLSLIVTHSQSHGRGFPNQLEGVGRMMESWMRLIDVKELGHTSIAGTLTVVQHVRRERIVVHKSDVDESSRSRLETAVHIMMNELREEITTEQQLVEDGLMGVNVVSVKTEIQY